MNKLKTVLSGKVIVGIFVLCVGILSLLENFHINIPIDPWEVWPVLLILAGAAMMTSSGRGHNLLSGLIIALIGALFLAESLIPEFHFHFSLLWPLILVFIGLRLIMRGYIPYRDKNNDQTFIHITAIFGGGDYLFSSKTIRGGEITAIMGGVDINLRQADFTQETLILNIFALCGGVDILVPDNWEVTLQGTPILGVMENNSKLNVNGIDGSPLKPVKKVMIRGNGIMGGIEVRN